jgi:CO/xanthine dehydrogenase Mo-binding subunit
MTGRERRGADAEKPDGEDRSMTDPFRTIGHPHWRVDGIGKVTGRARFGADLGAPGMLWGRVLLARRPHARIVSIDTSRVRDVPGVHTVLTAADLPFEKLFGVVIQNQPVLAVDRVRHYGDGVAMVAAETQEAAEEALGTIRVEYEELPGVVDPEEAMLPGAPQIHETSNVCVHHRVRKGNAAAGFAEAAIVIEQTYRTQHIEHAYIEPEAVLAEATEDGGVRVTGSIQNIFSTRRSLAAVLGCDLARVTVKHATMGGSFGGKDEVMTQMACRAVLLARAAGRPVKMVNSREHSMVESYKRHPYVLHYKVGAAADGRLVAVEARIVADAGAYASMSPFVTWRSAVQATGPYECPNVSTDVYAAYTNNCYTGAMRGFGSPQVNFAIESLIDELAERLGRDPLDLRLQNGIRRGSVTATGQKLDHDVSLGEVLRKAADRAGWSRRRREIDEANRARGDGKRAGIGLACSYRGVSLGAEGTDAVGAIVSVQTDGSVIVSAGLTDMGQGVSSALSLIAAEVLGIDTKRVKFWNVHTGRVPDSGPTVASRSTLMGGQAAKKAAEAVRDVLFDVVAETLGAGRETLIASGGRIFAREAPDRGRTFDEAVAIAFSRGRPLLGFGWHKSPRTTWDEATGQGDAYFTFVYGANIAEVEVDVETGRVEVLKVTAAHDVGRAISPAMVRSQIYGGVAMGMGYGILERFGIDDGIPTSWNLDEYLIATAVDMPDVETVLVENPDPLGPFGAKSVGEPATEITAPAITNAIAHALGRRIRELPADLEMVLLGKRLRKTMTASRQADDPKKAGRP